MITNAKNMRDCKLHFAILVYQIHFFFYSHDMWRVMSLMLDFKLICKIVKI